MKRLFFSFFTLCLWLFVSNAFAQASLASIRQQYADVKQRIARMSVPNSWPPEFYQVNVSQNLPATGLHREDIRMYYIDVDTDDEDVIYPPHRLDFVSTKYNFSVREFYEEYLYDATGGVCLIYARNPDIVFGLDYVFWIYCHEGHIVHAVVKYKPIKNANLEALKNVWDPTEPTDSEGFQLIYEGDELPARFQEIYDECVTSSEKYLKLFKHIDETTRL